jgi:hypothetical protein
MRRRRWLRAVCFALVSALAPAPQADETYLEPTDFVAQAFDGKPPATSKLWVEPALNEKVKTIVGSALPALRQKYWRQGERTVWILEAIGRDKPITAGYVVDHGIPFSPTNSRARR